jgi:hypothetical protein
LTRPVWPAFGWRDDGEGMGQPGLPCALRAWTTAVSGHQHDYPLVMWVRYHRADLDVEESLILSYGGEEYVTAAVVYPIRDQARARRTEIGADTAHTGFQLRRALDRQAQAVRELLTH